MQKQDIFNQMGHVARCYKIFFHKDLSISSSFYDDLILEIWTFKSLFSRNERLPSKAHTWYTSQNWIIESFQIVLCNINLPQYYITIESFIHKGHYIKVHWIHLIYPWSDRFFCTNLKVHNKLNTKDLTMKF
jgi:hypothetical protein